jgi:DtxR family Mn-dependent transcriptional regulator
MELTAKQEDYLEAIVEQVDASGVARVRDIAAAVAVHKSTVTSALRALARRGLVNYEPYQFVTLTAAGEAAARHVASRHGAIRRFLTDVLQVEDPVATENACRMEHVIDPPVLERLIRMARYAARESAAGRKWTRDLARYLAAGGSGRT